jgi:hypothetical protein
MYLRSNQNQTGLRNRSPLRPITRKRFRADGSRSVTEDIDVNSWAPQKRRRFEQAHLRAQAADARWFDANPSRQYRVRRPFRDELPAGTGGIQCIVVRKGVVREGDPTWVAVKWIDMDEAMLGELCELEEFGETLYELDQDGRVMVMKILERVVEKIRHNHTARLTHIESR